MNTIDFKDIQKVFDTDEWDVAYFSPSQMERVVNSPLKGKDHLAGLDVSDPLSLAKTKYELWAEKESHYFNGILLARFSERTGCYSLYEESFKMITDAFPDKEFAMIYLNFKQAAIQTGLGSRARNSLIYNRKFGFQCKFCAYIFKDEIVNYTQLSVNKNLLDLCEGCDDCIVNCPAQAIHEDWIDAKRCEEFIGWGNHPTIKSKKWFWYEKMQPDIPREVVESWTIGEGGPCEWGHGVDGYYELDQYTLKKDGVPVAFEHCNECQKQPRCSKAPILK